VVLAPNGLDHGLQCGRCEVLPRRAVTRPADRVAHPNVGEAPQLADLAGAHRVAPHPGAVLEDADRRHLVGSIVDSVAGVQRAGDHAHVRDLLAGGPALDLENRAADRPVSISGGDRQQLDQPVHQLGDTGAGGGRPGVHRVDQGLRGLRGQPAPQHGRRDPFLVVHVRGEQRVVVAGQRLDQPVVVRRARHRPRVPRTGPLDPGHRHAGDVEAAFDLGEHAVDVRAAAVDLVEEQQRRHPQPPQRPHEHPRLRLHALDGGDDEHRAVEHAQHPVDLGDEVGVPGRVDQVDRRAADGE
jgi:hypothetical protein